MTERNELSREKLNVSGIDESITPKNRKRKIIAASVAVICIAFFVMFTSIIIRGNRYNEALSKMNAGDYEAAITTFEALGGYMDSEDKAAEAYSAYLSAKLKTLEAGGTVVFGFYEQDNDTTNGSEPIEWQILAKEDDKLLVVSKYALDCRQYNTSYMTVEWATCSLREWLNSTFLCNSFSNAENAIIAETEVPAALNPALVEQPVPVAAFTNDKIFLLSASEVCEYFTTDEERLCIPTEYAVAQGAHTSEISSSVGYTSCWWLRTPGFGQDFNSFVSTNGSISLPGGAVNIEVYCIRPAMWINTGA